MHNEGVSTYIVFENTARTSLFGPVTVTRSRGITIDAAEVEVIDDRGTQVPVRNSEPNESITRGSKHYTAAVEFTAPHAGTYDVRFLDGSRTTVMIERPLGELYRRHVLALVDIGAGFIVVLVGIVMLAVGNIRRGRVRKREWRASAGASRIPPADWYRDPSGIARLRYWDGSQWTDYTAN